VFPLRCGSISGTGLHRCYSHGIAIYQFSGFVFGPFLGVLYTIVASNISSTIAFFVGHFFGEGLLKDDGSDGLVQRYARRMRENSFETVMIMRFIFLPYDFVS
jgi:uncharacterized membrane protein YdjX (TVP38/TMEM64 family)